MNSVRPLFFLLVISFFASSALAAGDGSDPQSSNGFVPNQTADPALFGRDSADRPASELFFLKDRPRLNFATPAGPPRSAVLNDADCYTMRMYKVKRKEHFADGESGVRGYSTCQLASNYQVRTAVAHVQTPEGNDSRSDAQK